MNKEVTAPLVSVVIPAYNCEAFVADTLTSVVNQTYPSVEIIVVNDGSTDETSYILTSFETQIKIIDQPNGGVSKARNVGIAAAQGEYIAFLDADDQWEPTKLEAQVDGLNGCEWNYTDSHYFGDSSLNGQKRSDLSPLPEGRVFQALIEENFLTTSTILIRKSIVESVGGFDENIALLEDWILWLRIAQTHPVSKIDQPLVSYRVSEHSAYRSAARESLDAHLYIYQSVLPSLKLDADTNSIVRRGVTKSYNICSYIAEETQDFKFALYCAWKSMISSAPSPATIKRLVRTMLNVVLK